MNDYEAWKTLIRYHRAGLVTDSNREQFHAVQWRVEQRLAFTRQRAAVNAMSINERDSFGALIRETD